MRWHGKLERLDLEGGVWQLQTRDGTFSLTGDVPAHLAGQEVEVEGEEDAGFGFAMTGPSITVRKVHRR